MSRLESVAFNSQGMRESKRDHAATWDAIDKQMEDGRTLCGRRLSRHWFPRQTKFTGLYKFECKRCASVARRLGLIPVDHCRCGKRDGSHADDCDERRVSTKEKLT